VKGVLQNYLIKLFSDRR